MNKREALVRISIAEENTHTHKNIHIEVFNVENFYAHEYLSLNIVLIKIGAHPTFLFVVIIKIKVQ